MIAYVFLTLGSALLAVSVLLILWPRVRVLRFQNDLLELRIRAIEEMAAVRLPIDDEFRNVDESVAFAIKAAPKLTSSFYFIRLVEAQKLLADGKIKPDPPRKNPIAARLELHWCNRTMFYFIFETFSGMLLSAIALTVLGWRQFKTSWVSGAWQIAAVATIHDRRHCLIH